MAIGLIESFSQSLAMGLINEGICGGVTKVFTDSVKDYVKAASAWTIGQIGKHSSEHALHLINQNGLMQLHEAHLDRYASHDLQRKTKRALKRIIDKCTDVEALQPLIDRAPNERELMEREVVEREAGEGESI
jgi:hypothetical protein